MNIIFFFDHYFRVLYNVLRRVPNLHIFGFTSFIPILPLPYISGLHRNTVEISSVGNDVSAADSLCNQKSSAVTGHKEPFNLTMGGHALTDGKLWSTYQLKWLGQDNLKMLRKMGQHYPKGKSSM